MVLGRPIRDRPTDELASFDDLREEAFRRAFFSVGPYAFSLDVTRNRTLEMFSGREPGVAGYRRVVDAIAVKVRALAK